MRLWKTVCTQLWHRGRSCSQPYGHVHQTGFFQTVALYYYVYDDPNVFPCLFDLTRGIVVTYIFGQRRTHADIASTMPATSLLFLILKLIDSVILFCCSLLTAPQWYFHYHWGVSKPGVRHFGRGPSHFASPEICLICLKHRFSLNMEKKKKFKHRPCSHVILVSLCTQDMLIPLGDA